MQLLISDQSTSNMCVRARMHIHARACACVCKHISCKCSPSTHMQARLYTPRHIPTHMHPHALPSKHKRLHVQPHGAHMHAYPVSFFFEHSSTDRFHYRCRKPVSVRCRLSVHPSSPCHLPNPWLLLLSILRFSSRPRNLSNLQARV